MSTSKEYLSFLLDQLSSLDGISYRMMMGEYLIYYRGKVAAYICDDRFLVRPIPAAIKMLPDAEYDAIMMAGERNYLELTTLIIESF